MTFTEFLTYIVPIVPIVVCPLISTLVRYLEGTANIELQELEKDMENTDSPEVDVLGFVYERTKEQVDRERRALSFDGVTVHTLNEYSPDLMVEYRKHALSPITLSLRQITSVIIVEQDTFQTRTGLFRIVITAEQD